MRVIPVLDLQSGQVVQAIAGERERYRPIRSVLTGDSEPAAVAAAFLDLAPFERLYAADLDAITQHGSPRHFDPLRQIARECGRRGLRELWLDAGRAPWVGELSGALAESGVKLVPVVGTESLADDAHSGSIESPAGCEEPVLSLDYRQGRFLGPPDMETDVRRWPRRVIAMDLAVVGGRRGPSCGRLRQLRKQAASAAQRVDLYAAGGVRDIEDLHALAVHGVAGALVASALHDGTLDRPALRLLDSAPPQ